MPLTRFAIVNAAPRDKPYKLADGGGLHLRVQPNGSKLWRLRYRFNGQENMLAFGTFPSISLANAKTKRDEARGLLASGMNPSVKRKLDKIAAATAARNTFGDIAAEHLANLEATAPPQRRWRKTAGCHRSSVPPSPNGRLPRSRPLKFSIYSRRVEKSGRRETATSLRGKIGSVFRYGVVTLRATNDPTYALRGALLKVKVTHRAAIIDELQLGALMKSIDQYGGWTTCATQHMWKVVNNAPNQSLQLNPELIFFAVNLPAQNQNMALLSHQTEYASQCDTYAMTRLNITEREERTLVPVPSPP
jgi:hypothetical protein